MSRIWTIWQKILGLALFPGGLLFPLFLLTQPAQTCASSGEGAQAVTTCTGFTLPVWLGVPLFLVLVATPLVVAAYLSSALRSGRSAPGGENVQVS